MKKYIITLNMIIILGNFAYSQKLNLLAYWSFDDSTARDHSGNGYHGVLMNTPTPIMGVDGLHTAFHFVGRDYQSDRGDHILLPELDIPRYKKFSISLWVKEQNLTESSGEAYIWFGYVNSGWLGIDHCWQHSNPMPPSNTNINYSSGSNVSTQWPISATFDFSKDRNRWVHYVLTYNDGVIKGYKDGFLIKTGFQKLNISSTKAAIVRHWWTYSGEARTSTRFTGDIDEVMIYTDELSDDNVTDLFLLGKYYNICEGSDVVLKAPDGYTDYKWSNGMNGQSITVNDTGSYIVTVKTSSGKTYVAKPYIVAKKAIKYQEFKNMLFEYKNEDNTKIDSVIIKNVNDYPITIDKINLKKNEENGFVIKTDKSLPLTLDEGHSIKVNIEFKPKEKKDFHDSIVIETSLPCFNKKYIKISGSYKDCFEKYSFNFNSFIKSDSLNFNGKAYLNSNKIRLTQSTKMQIGSAWYYGYVPIKNGFVSRFKFRLLEGNNFEAQENSLPGGDGFAFVIAGSKEKTLGLSGGGLGYMSIPNTIAIEFDMFSNDHNQIETLYDPNGNHLAVQSCGVMPNSAIHCDSSTFGLKSDIISLIPDGRIYYCKIDYNQIKSTLRIWVDSTEDFNATPLVVSPFTVDDIIKLTQSEWALLGFTAATGTVAQIHEILSWDFCPNPTSSIFIGVEENQKDMHEDIIAFPNPFTDNVVFNTNVALSNDYFNLRIYNNLGIIVFSKSGSNEDTIEWKTPNIDNGSYFYILNYGNQTKFGKLVKY